MGTYSIYRTYSTVLLHRDNAQSNTATRLQAYVNKDESNRAHAHKQHTETHPVVYGAP